MFYEVSDIHGQYDKFMELLEKIHFSDADTLYVVGDVVDRGPQPMQVLLYMMNKPNILPIFGNHEVMCLTNLHLLQHEITDEFLDSLSAYDYGNLIQWIANGAQPTIQGFHALSGDDREAVMDYLKEFSADEEVTMENGKNYVLVHAGLPDFSESKPLCEYDVYGTVWTRPDFKGPYYSDKTLIVGHTPTHVIENNAKPGFIYHGNGIVDIDCGAYLDGGRLAALCLDTGEEFYSE